MQQRHATGTTTTTIEALMRMTGVFDALQAGLGQRKGEVKYLRLLHLAVKTLEEEVGTALNPIHIMPGYGSGSYFSN
jgi:hypothetical protein